MSRIGKIPVIIPDKVKVQVKNQHVAVEGPNGKLALDVHHLATVKVDDQQVLVTRPNDNKESKAIHGLVRSLIQNMVIGVSKGFVKQLEIQGVGFKATMANKKITLNLGYSHEIVYPVPDSIVVTLEDGGTKIKIEGPDKQLVGKVASEIRSFYPPEPYKGKGVRYSDEQVKRKEGKTVQ
ncbi:MAG: 50S ribosomal protein L6 [Limisphaerales bacterium]|jgi:large subunit ribosomal protein L6|nr:50S ribosomal protein L6 [Pedosphaera sp.]HAQ98066.1 50S ribosomal protein L6 [Verrucomicrobiales bacterium]HBP56160.1 50S ribosomal protein L6 [Verrucomicrobiales bacterium]HCP39560.1 50S ribosomal protein L6 [Verrucomicrobiales bacterium]HCZ01963.1 50S ribosomal protein L6 [Verrucomicrobiales bacterium]|tara:strand:- start:472 stop:1011 length:540 start_codon:yes stop_codon:yes gene_type:complete